MLDLQRRSRRGAWRRAPWLAVSSLALLAACSTEPNFGGGQGGDGGGAPNTSSTGASTGAAEGAGGAGGTTMSVSVSTSVSVTVSTGSGGACATDGDCADGDPCTDDTCESGVCARFQKPTGQPGNTTEGACVGVCQLDGGCGLRVFSRPFVDDATDVNWEVTTLSELWPAETSPPPYDDIVAADALPSLGLLLVFTSTGALYVRGDMGLWQAFPDASEALPGLPPTVRGAYSLRYDEASADTELTIVTEGADIPQVAYIYVVRGIMNGRLDVVPYVDNPVPVDRTDEAGEGPALDSVVRWQIIRQRGFQPAPDWLELWEQSDANVYTYATETAAWVNHGLDTDSPIWAIGGEAPASESVMAAWFDGELLHLVAP